MIEHSMHDDEHDMSPADAEFARQLAVPMRAPEPIGADFDARVMAEIRRAPLTVVRAAPALRRRRALALPPLAWGALAAGFAAVVSLATLAVVHRVAPSSSVASAPVQPRVQLAAAAPSADTVYVVRFVLADSRAHTVTLLGDFNAWQKQATPLRVTKPGIWSAQVALTPGRHEYAFLVDGKRWVADPDAEHHSDDFGTQSSVVTVGANGVTE
jgi:plastocyanin